jgi:hypothetical protein
MNRSSRAGRVGLLGGMISAIALVLLVGLTNDTASVSCRGWGMGLDAVTALSRQHTRRFRRPVEQPSLILGQSAFDRH